MCNCDWETGECQAPLGCKAVAEVSRLRAALREVASIELPYDYAESCRVSEIARLVLEQKP